MHSYTRQNWSLNIYIYKSFAYILIITISRHYEINICNQFRSFYRYKFIDKAHCFAREVRILFFSLCYIKGISQLSQILDLKCNSCQENIRSQVKMRNSLYKKKSRHFYEAKMLNLPTLDCQSVVFLARAIPVFGHSVKS